MNPTTETEQLPPLPLPLPAFKILKRPSPMAASSSSHHSPGLTLMGQDQILSILHLLPADSILAFSMTCRRFRSIAAADSLWQSICRREWGGGRVDALLASLPSHVRTELRWSRVYQEVSQLGSLYCRPLSSRDAEVPRPRASHSLNFVSDCLVLFGGGCEGAGSFDLTTRQGKPPYVALQI